MLLAARRGQVAYATSSPLKPACSPRGCCAEIQARLAVQWRCRRLTTGVLHMCVLHAPSSLLTAPRHDVLQGHAPAYTVTPSCTSLQASS